MFVVYCLSLLVPPVGQPHEDEADNGHQASKCKELQVLKKCSVLTLLFHVGRIGRLENIRPHI